MKDLIPLGLGANDNDPDNEFLVEHDACIQAKARKVIPSGLFSEDVLDLEIDELAQTIRIKLWKSRQKRSISNPEAYVSAIAYTTSMDMMRRHRPTVSLFADENEEPSLSNFLVARSAGLQDPAYEIELEQIDPDFLKNLVEAILSLPLRQMQALLYSIRERKEDGLPLIKALKTQGIDIEVLEQLDEESEVHLLKASLSVARKKLQGLRERRTIAV